MDFSVFRAQHYFFDLNPYGRIYVFVDFGNVRPWAKELWPMENKVRIMREIYIMKLADVCDWVSPARKFFYYGHFPARHHLPREHNDNLRHRTSVLRLDKARRAG